jgi:cell division septum initiation protein DivIVA
MQTEDKLLEEWLSSCRSDNTRDAYKSHIRIFKAWYHEPLTKFLRLNGPNKRNEALKFQNEMLKQGRKANSVTAMITALASFCQWQGKPLPFKRQRLPMEMDKTSHRFTTKDLTAMYDVGDLQEKAIVSLFTSLSWEASAVLTLDREHVEKLIHKARDETDNFVFFADQRQKTHVERLGILNPLAIESLEKWFKIWHEPRLFRYTSVDGLNKAIQRLAKKSGIVATGRIHSHLFRKWTITQLNAAWFTEPEWKLISGKKIAVSDRTYLQGLPEQIETKYRRVYDEFLTIRPTHIANGKVKAEVEELKEQVKELRESHERALRGQTVVMYNAWKAGLKGKEIPKELQELIDKMTVKVEDET